MWNKKIPLGGGGGGGGGLGLFLNILGDWIVLFEINLNAKLLWM